MTSPVTVYGGPPVRPGADGVGLVTSPVTVAADAAGLMTSPVTVYGGPPVRPGTDGVGLVTASVTVAADTAGLMTSPVTVTADLPPDREPTGPVS
ncbi:hypothetical protein ACFQ3Z_20405 [Streptomyces nogalater]